MIVSLCRKVFSLVVLHAALTVITVLALVKHFLAIYWINSTTHEDSRDTRPASFAKVIDSNLKAINRDEQTTASDQQRTGGDYIHFDHATNNPFDNLILAEDLNLVPNLQYYYNQYNIDIEEFKVLTNDGFLIDLWHLKSRDYKYGARAKTLRKRTRADAPRPIAKQRVIRVQREKVLGLPLERLRLRRVAGKQQVRVQTKRQDKAEGFLVLGHDRHGQT